MAKKGPKHPPGLDDQNLASSAPIEQSPISESPSAAQRSPTPPLIICRNKHWRYISSWHGTWLQVPTEVLETVANVNYSTLRPRPIDPATFFDLVKIRRLVDEATNLAVRAASGISSPILTNVNGGLPEDAAMTSLALAGPGHSVKLSRERKFRMREQASQKLGRAYRLNEVASSVATMQEASPLESVGTLVLQRNPDDIDAQYVHFFHEKIPSRQLMASTSLEPLYHMIAERPAEPEFLRTTALAKNLMGDYEGAVHDFTLALSVYRRHQEPPSLVDRDSQQYQGSSWNMKRPQDIILAEKDQPSSLESQLMFFRANAYLSLACQHLEGAMKPPGDQNGHAESTRKEETPALDTNGGVPLSQEESRKMVKTYAKRSLRDYMAFLSTIEYAPKLPVRVPVDFNERVNVAAHGIRNPRSSDTGPPIEPYKIYPISELFAAVPPADIPPFPSKEPEDVSPGDHTGTCEAATFHPLLSDALHSVLLCHCLVQTSTKELLRHAYMVARLARLSDGYPIFPGGRSPARSDWIDLVHRMDNWLQLDGSWEDLIAPAPLPHHDKCENRHGPSFERAASAAAAMINGEPSEAERIKEARKKAILNAWCEKRGVNNIKFEAVADDDNPGVKRFRAVISNGPPAAEQNPESAAAAPDTSPVSVVTVPVPSAPGANLVVDDGPGTDPLPTDGIPEYPTAFYGERASAIAQWLREAPKVKGATRRKKRTKKPAVQVEGLDGAMKSLGVGETAEPIVSG